MDTKKSVFIFILFFAVCTGFCEQKAKVLTVTGKKWDVVFIRLHSDTIYLQVPKANGKNMGVSGHKTKFKKVEFSDGTMLDLSLSNYPPEHEIKISGDIGDWPGPNSNFIESQSAISIPSPEPTVPKKSTFIEDSLALNALASHVQKETRPDSSMEKKALADHAVLVNVREKSDSTGGAISISSKPSSASIILDGKPLEAATTPYTIKHLASGRHGIRVAKDSLYAFTIVTVKEYKTITINLRLKKEPVVNAPSPVKRKNHALAWSLCMSSVVLFAGSAASYYFALDDQKKALEAKNLLENSLVPGKNYEENLEINKQKSDAARLKISISEILLGVGAIDLGLGIVFFF
jgi:hypothetical protein